MPGVTELLPVMEDNLDGQTMFPSAHIHRKTDSVEAVGADL